MSKDRMINTTRVEGRLYQHKLEKRVTGENSKAPGTEYIRGTVDIATDDAMLNVVSVYYNYVVATTKSGVVNETYVNLSNIINGVLPCAMDVGPERAAKLRLDSSIGVNDFLSERNGVTEMVSAKRNEGGFVRAVSALNADENQRNTFNCDMIITGVTHMEADEERGFKAKSNVSGYIFDYRKAILPVTFSATNPGAMRYFEGLDASETNPVFTRVKGQQVSNTVVRKIVEESAFGDPIVREVQSSRKDFEITWAQPEEYIWDDPTTFTKEELKAAQQEREVHLADVRTRAEEWQNRSSGGAFANVATDASARPAPKMEFDF